MTTKQDFEKAIKENIKPVVSDYGEGDTDLDLDGELEAINACYVLATKLAKEMAIGFYTHYNPNAVGLESAYDEFRRNELKKVKTN